MMESPNISRTLAAIADPTRRAIIARLAAGEMSVAEIASPLAMTQPAVSHHLKVLEQAGLIRRRIDQQRRPCALVPGAFAPLEGWLRQLRDTMEMNYQRLDRLLAETDTIQEGKADGIES